MNSETHRSYTDYRFGRPKVYLTSIEIARLVIVRSKLGDTRAEREAEKIPAVGSQRTRGRDNRYSA
jgi:hypothetical protein